MEDRKNFIGASECSSIMGVNPFCTPLKLYGLKTGLIGQEEEQENQYWGKKKEGIIAERFAEDHGVKLMAWKKRFVHPSMPFFSCELDRIIVGTEDVVECKSVNEHLWKQWEKPDELPSYVIIQTTAQMGLSGRNRAWVSCLCGASKYIEKLVLFDAELYAMIEKKVDEFWKMVQDKTPPLAMGQDNTDIVDIYPKSGELIQLVEEMNASIALLQQTKNDIKALDATKDELEAKLKQVIGENAGVKTSQYLAKWSPVKGSTYTVTKKDSKMLRISLNKEKKDE